MLNLASLRRLALVTGEVCRGRYKADSRALVWPLGGRHCATVHGADSAQGSSLSGQ